MDAYLQGIVGAETSPLIYGISLGRTRAPSVQ